MNVVNGLLVDNAVSAAYGRVESEFCGCIFLQVEISMIALAYKNRMWFKAAHGVDFNSYNRRLSFCTW
jgi:hypothetical protein